MDVGNISTYIKTLSIFKLELANDDESNVMLLSSSAVTGNSCRHWDCKCRLMTAAFPRSSLQGLRPVLPTSRLSQS